MNNEPIMRMTDDYLTLNERLEIVLKKANRAMTVSEVYEEYLLQFPEYVYNKLKKYDTVKAGFSQIKSEVASVLASNPARFKKNVSYTVKSEEDE
jgi:hypothetical protein